MMKKVLQGLTVLVTRPEQQGAALCEMIKHYGGRAYLFPAIIIEPVEDKQVLLTAVGQLRRFDLAIFISANAVLQSITAIQAQWSELPQGLSIAAMGLATAKTLQQFGISTDICPQRFNSESFLAMPELQHIQGKRIILFRGEQGRILLADTLRERGAKLLEVACYRRCLPAVTQADCQAIYQHQNVDLIVSTSSESLTNLFALFAEEGKKWLQSCHWLVISERLLPIAQKLGIKQVSLVADNASDQAIINTLIQFVEEQQWNKK